MTTVDSPKVFVGDGVNPPQLKEYGKSDAEESWAYTPLQKAMDALDARIKHYEWIVEYHKDKGEYHKDKMERAQISAETLEEVKTDLRLWLT